MFHEQKYFFIRWELFQSQMTGFVYLFKFQIQ